MSNYYVVYRGDNLICHGTKNECADFLNIRPETLIFYRSNVYKNRRKDTAYEKKIFVVKVEGKD